MVQAGKSTHIRKYTIFPTPRLCDFMVFCPQAGSFSAFYTGPPLTRLMGGIKPVYAVSSGVLLNAGECSLLGFRRLRSLYATVIVGSSSLSLSSYLHTPFVLRLT